MKKDTSYRSTVVLPAVVLALALLAACGNSGKKTTSPATAPGLASAAAVGMNTCTTCHTAVTADWLASRHANLDPGGLDSTGKPALAQISGCTANCHDPGGDSGRLVAGYTGNVPRPVVGCEACHGPGSLHAEGGGTGPIAFAAAAAGALGSTQVSAQFRTCTSCHELLDAAGTGKATAAHDAGGSDPRVVSAGTSTNIIVNSNVNSISDTHFATPGAWRPASAGSLNVHNTTTDFIAVTGFAMDFADEKVCSNCHNPHKNAVINREWAQSAHADPQGIKIEPKSGAVVGNGFFSSAWAHYNWSIRPECQRCHTTTGFIAYAEALRAGNTDLASKIKFGTASPPPLAPVDGFKPELLKCNGCHTDNRGNLRNAGAVTANYDFLSGGKTFSLVSHTYPDVAGSNVCMLCHTAREIGDSIKTINNPVLLSAGSVSAADFGNFGFVNSHYLSAGATVFTTSGYTFGDRNYANIASYRHDQIGTPGAPGTGTNGPCIGCHMSRPNKNGNHLFLPVSRVSSGTTVTITGIASEVCFTCHGPNDVLMLDLVREQRNLFGEALEALKEQLENRGYFFADASPYFYNFRDNQGQVAVTTGSDVVTNVTGSFWLASGVTGTDALGIIADRFRVNVDGRYYAIRSVDSGTQITLQAPYTGTTRTNADYTIIGASTKNWLTSGDTDATGNTTGKNNMGAAFNFNLFEHDPGAYAHNRYFVKRLLYDSLDWLDDNQLNFSVGTTLTAVCGVPQPPAFCTGATTYLLPNGVINGVAAERP